MTGDGLTLVWSDQTVAGGNITSARIMLARRGNTGDPFGTPAPFRPNAGTQIRMSPFVTRDGNELFFSQLEGQDIIHIYRSVLGDDLVYGVPERVDELASPDGSEGGIAMSNDGLTMYFASSRAGAQGANDMYVATRADRSSPWTGIARSSRWSATIRPPSAACSPRSCSPISWKLENSTRMPMPTRIQRSGLPPPPAPPNRPRKRSTTSPMPPPCRLRGFQLLFRLPLLPDPPLLLPGVFQAMPTPS